jgi:protein-L-isoaspartate(D-aspartate) O-methyltransferase
MVDVQIVARGITSVPVIEAMRRVPRHRFVPEEFEAQAYEDHPIHIGQGQTISQPYMVAIMSELLDVKVGDSVLEIGAGSGYQAAILGEMASRVITIERDAELAEAARQRLLSMGYAHITVITADGTLGYEPKAPYDAIMVTAGAPYVPEALKRQLKLGGRLICPAGPRAMQTLTKITTHCIFVPLIGEEGWPS